LEGETFSNGQEHLYLETQGCYAVPQENGSIKITSSTQGPTQVQKAAARVLGVPMHKIEVDVIRLGGGFGGKEDQATPWAVMAAVAVQHLNKPVKYILNRHAKQSFYKMQEQQLISHLLLQNELYSMPPTVILFQM